MQTIELDCAPGGIRPDSVLIEVLKGTGIEPVKAETKFFGNWTFNYSHISAEKWAETKPILKERIIAAYNRGIIRYGSW